jgi:hypothetical protein
MTVQDRLFHFGRPCGWPIARRLRCRGFYSSRPVVGASPLRDTGGAVALRGALRSWLAVASAVPGRRMWRGAGLSLFVPGCRRQRTSRHRQRRSSSSAQPGLLSIGAWPPRSLKCAYACRIQKRSWPAAAAGSPRVVKISKCTEGSRSSMMDIEDEHNHMGAALRARLKSLPPNLSRWKTVKPTIRISLMRNGIAWNRQADGPEHRRCRLVCFQTRPKFASLLSASVMGK